MNFENIWQEYRTGIKAFLSARISDPTEVEDLLQEILIKTYENLHTVRSHKSVKSWLFQIANHATIDFYRKNNRRMTFDVEDLWYSQNTPDVKQELSNCVEPFMNALPEETAELIRAIDIRGQSQKIYAQEHQIPYSTLKSRVKKGRDQLKALFTDCCHLSFDQRGDIMAFEVKAKSCKKC